MVGKSDLPDMCRKIRKRRAISIQPHVKQQGGKVGQSTRASSTHAREALFPLIKNALNSHKLVWQIWEQAELEAGSFILKDIPRFAFLQKSIGYFLTAQYSQ